LWLSQLGKYFIANLTQQAEGKYGEEVTTLGSVDATGVVYSRKNGAKTKGCRCCVQPRAFRDSTAAMPGRYVTGNNVIKKIVKK
jgi:hypothetical protein